MLNTRVANELLSCLLHSLHNNVTVRAPFAANFQISFRLKNGGEFNSCRNIQEALIAGVESNMISVMTREDLGETPKGSNVWMWHSQKCSECGLSLTGWESFEN